MSLKPAFPHPSLIRWYRKNKRDLPWRKNRDPYKVWISEIMLQQTRVDNVLTYYARFLESFPDLKSLSRSHENEVLRRWSGLGYYSRARNLLKTAKIIARDFGGIFPDNYEQLVRLPGIGPYTAGALLSIAFNKPVPILDGNVRRVLGRFFLEHSQERLWEISRKIVEDCPERRIAPSGFNQALMELGALACFPKNPSCSGCPLGNSCLARRKDPQSSYPQVKKRPETIHKSFVMAILESDKGPCGKSRRLLICRRSKRRRWLKNLWEFPMIPISRGLSLESPERFLKPLALKFSKKIGSGVRLEKSLGEIKHSITRHNLKILVVKGETSGKTRLPSPLWMGARDLETVSSSSILRKALALYRTVQGSALLASSN